MHTLRHNWQSVSLIDFNNWLKEKAEGHEKLRAIGSRAKTEETVQPKTKKCLNQTIKALAITKASLIIRRACCVKESMPFGLSLRSRKRKPLSESNL